MNFNLKMKIMKKFGTQKKFAKAVNESEYIVCRAVRGTTKLSSERLVKFAQTLACKPEEIMDTEGGE